MVLPKGEAATILQAEKILYPFRGTAEKRTSAPWKSKGFLQYKAVHSESSLQSLNSFPGNCFKFLYQRVYCHCILQSSQTEIDPSDWLVMAPAYLASSLGTTLERTRSLSLFHLVKHSEWEQRCRGSCWALWVQVLMFSFTAALRFIVSTSFTLVVFSSRQESLKKKGGWLTVISFPSRTPFLRISSLRWLFCGESFPVQLSKEYNRPQFFSGLACAATWAWESLLYGGTQWVCPLNTLPAYIYSLHQQLVSLEIT